MSVRYTNNSLALDVLNASIPPTPLTAATPAALSTLSSMGGVNLRGNTILDSQTVNALISQQSASNTTLDAISKIKLGIVPGNVGATITQLSNPGGLLKPGLDEFIQSKLNMGVSFQNSISNSLLTGANGVSTVQNFLTNPTAQLNVVKDSITNSVNGLINRGVISGAESATQIGGVALAGATFGVSNVAGVFDNFKNGITGGIQNLTGSLTTGLTNIGSNITSSLTNIGTNLTSGLTNIAGNITDKIGGITNMLSSGNFAAGITDKLSSSLTSNISGALTGAVGSLLGAAVGKLFGKGKASITIGAIAGMLAGQARAAHAQAKAAIASKAMKPGEANYLDQSVPPREYSLAEQQAAKIKATEMELDAADSAALSARVEYNQNPTPENLAALRDAEAALQRAKQQTVAVASAILSPQSAKRSLLGGLKSAVTSITGTIQDSVSRGVKAFDDIKKAASVISTAYATGGLSLLANSKLGSSISALTNPQKLAGDLMSKFTNAASNVLGSATDKVRGLLGGLGGPKGVKNPTYASDTDKNKSVIAGNTGQLLGDSRVPPPPTLTGETITDLTPNEYVRLQAVAIRALEDLEAQREIAQLKLERLIEQLGDSANSAILIQINSARNTLASIDVKISVAQQRYENTIRGA